jgi:hypothetical protein
MVSIHTDKSSKWGYNADLYQSTDSVARNIELQTNCEAEGLIYSSEILSKCV